MANDDDVISEMTFGTTEIRIVEILEGDTLHIVSHKPFSDSYTCTIRQDVLKALHQQNTLAPFLTLLNAAMQLLVTSEST